jgi:SHS family lactate transporter-like MFS transporter
LAAGAVRAADAAGKHAHPFAVAGVDVRVFSEHSPQARKTFTASFLGWTLDAFDFFLLTFVVTRIAADFHQAIVNVAFAITLTLMCRPLGALIFGWIGDRYGRRTPLMIDVAFFSIVELLTAFSPNFTVFLVLRALYGIAMGGEWGLGAAMAMESLPPQRRGLFSGILQQGYMVGYLVAALTYFLVFHFAPALGVAQWDWRMLFCIGALPAVLIFYIRAQVPESPAFVARKPQPGALWRAIAQHWVLFVYAIALMAAFNFMSHGTQDLYATFLQKQHGFGPGQTSTLSIVAAFGAIAGGILFGGISQRAGPRATILICAVLGMLVIPLWALSSGLVILGVGAFLMQFMVQGAWGVIPAHLNELSPGDARGTFPGFTYQIGNLISAGAAQMEVAFAGHFPLANGVSDYGKAMAILAAAMFAAVFALTAVGFAVHPENRHADFLTTQNS